MDDGEIDFSNQEVFSNPNMAIPSSCSMDSFFDDLLKDVHTCTHTHTCIPPGPDYSHTHTCFHVHTKILPASPEEDKVVTDDTAESTEKKSKKRPLGNQEAVRKYREKKKARAASLEDEVVRLRALNQHLMKRLQGQAALEAEITRLKCLLVDIRGRIEGEIGSFPYQKTGNPNLSNTSNPGAYVMNPCNMQCDDQVYCLRPEGNGSRSGEGAVINGQSFGACGFENLQCLVNHDSGSKELLGDGMGNAVSNDTSSGVTKRKVIGIVCARSYVWLESGTKHFYKGVETSP
ncbi:basic leucine zipper 23-like isoform X2 [Cucurbita pepo subsp. pepo]|uniref:basic leucine zipper 23-like isoform X2 n=1 Tax=Cucurbita pepo subsp. pepo TaxID=3664 RepID=UPI000C9D500C|nr:basic leucine zipper 23-like isoform X2 [Cucurbita pepo subsp. pepo]